MHHDLWGVGIAAILLGLSMVLLNSIEPPDDALASSSTAPSVQAADETLSGTLSNLSTRGRAAGGDQGLIGGFIVRHAPVTVVLRALGPSLQERDVRDTARDPGLQLFSDQTMLAANDDWIESPDAERLIGLSLAPEDAHESAILASLPPGEYTAVLLEEDPRHVGIALVEIFRVGGDGRLVNLSTRAEVGQDEHVMIGGFIVSDHPTTVVVRALGPTLAGRGIANPLSDLRLELHRGRDRLSINDDWTRGAGADAIEERSLAPPSPIEPAIIARLDPGAYTAAVHSMQGHGIGTALVEVFRTRHDPALRFPEAGPIHLNEVPYDEETNLRYLHYELTNTGRHSLGIAPPPVVTVHDRQGRLITRETGAVPIEDLPAGASICVGGMRYPKSTAQIGDRDHYSIEGRTATYRDTIIPWQTDLDLDILRDEIRLDAGSEYVTHTIEVANRSGRHLAQVILQTVYYDVQSPSRIVHCGEVGTGRLEHGTNSMVEIVIWKRHAVLDALDRTPRALRLFGLPEDSAVLGAHAGSFSGPTSSLRSAP